MMGSLELGKFQDWLWLLRAPSPPVSRKCTLLESVQCVCSKIGRASAFDAGAAMAGETLTLDGVQLQVARGELLGICGEVRRGSLPFKVLHQLKP